MMKVKTCMRAESPPARPFRRGLYHSISFTDHMDLVSTSADISTDRDQSADLCPAPTAADHRKVTAGRQTFVKREGDTDGSLISKPQLAPIGLPRLAAASPTSTTWLRPSAHPPVGAAAAAEAAGGAAGGCDSGTEPFLAELLPPPSPPPTAVGVGTGADTSRPPWSRAYATTGTSSSYQLHANPQATDIPTSARNNSVLPASSFTPVKLVQRISSGCSKISPGGVTVPECPPCGSVGTGRTRPRITSSPDCHTPHVHSHGVTPTPNPGTPTTPKTHRIIATLTPNGLPLDYFCSPLNVKYPGVCNHGNTIEGDPSCLQDKCPCGRRGGVKSPSQPPGTKQKGLRRSRSACGQEEAGASRVNTSRGPPTPGRLKARDHQARSPNSPPHHQVTGVYSTREVQPVSPGTLSGGQPGSSKDSENLYSHKFLQAQERDIWIPRHSPTSLSSSFSPSAQDCELLGYGVKRRPELCSSSERQTHPLVNYSSRSLPSSPVRYAPLPSRISSPFYCERSVDVSSRPLVMEGPVVAKTTVANGHTPAPSTQDDCTDQPDMMEDSCSDISGDTPRNPIILFQDAGGGKPQRLVPANIDKNLSLTVYLRRWSAFHEQSEGASGPPPAAPRLATPYLIERSSSVGATPSEGQSRYVQRSPSCQQTTSNHGQSNNTNSATTSRLQRQRSYKRSEDDDKLKKSRAWANAYELSQDLHEKQLEMLERKYGGQLRARRAARIIQQAFRHYSMNKNFEKLRSVAGEKRLSRRFAELQRSNTIWTDMVVDSGYNVGLDVHVQQQYMKGELMGVPRSGTIEDNLNQNIGGRRLQKSYSLNMSSHTLMQESIAYRQQRRPLQRSMGLDLTSIKESKVHQSKKRREVVAPSPEETNNNRNSYPEMNDSSASDSPHETPVEPTVDLPSVNFENLLESKETDILNDSFHSDSSQDAPVSAVPTSGPGSGKFSSFAAPVDQSGSCDDITSDQTVTRQPNRTSNYYTGHYSEHNVQIKVDAPDGHSLENSALPSSDSDRTPTQEDGEFRVYDNTLVRLRKKKGASVSSNSSSSSCSVENQTYPTSTSPHPNQIQQSPVVVVQQPQTTLNGAPLPDEGTMTEEEYLAAQAQIYIQAAQGATKMSPEASPIWKRKSQLGVNGNAPEDVKRMSNISEASEPESLDGREGLSSSTSSETASLCSDSGPGGYHRTLPNLQKDSPQSLQPAPLKITDRQRKRLYRIGLNLFNKKPEKGIKYLIERRFIDNRPAAVAKFLITRKGLSKQMIGEFLGNLQKPFNNETLIYFAEEIDLSGLQVDMALRKFQSYFRMPGEAQKIERLMEAFAERYYICNPDQVKKFRSPDSIFLLAFAIIMLNTDLHNKNIKTERKMKPEDFIKNLRGIDDGMDIDRDMLLGIYDRIYASEFRPGTDHVSQVMKVESMIVGKKPQLALPHRRLVCYCRLYEVNDPNKREKLGLHQREVFLFNDLIMITKIFSKKKSHGISYTFRQSFSLCGMQVYLFETSHYQHGIRLTTNIDGKVLITFNARNEHDRSKFVEDLKEAILEMNEMEALRIEEELQKQKLGNQHNPYNRHSKDSGMVDIELLRPSDPGTNRLSAPECGMKKTGLSNSLMDLSDATLRRSSGGSLDSGMASTSSGSTGSHEDGMQAKGLTKASSSSSRFGGLFGKKSKSSSSKTSLKHVTSDSSEV